MSNYVKKIALVLIGKTHAGKTSFARSLKERFETLEILEADPIGLFLKREYPTLHQKDDKEHSGVFKNVSLKFKLYEVIIEYTLQKGGPCILANSNMWQLGRDRVLALLTKYDYYTMGVYFDYSEDVLLSHVASSTRSTEVLRTSKNYVELLENQRDRMQAPSPTEFSEYIAISSPGELEKVHKQLVSCLA